jgi:hypothetical protein
LAAANSTIVVPREQTTKRGDDTMKLTPSIHAIETFTGLAAFLVVTALVGAPLLHADDDERSSGDAARIERGLEIAPVPLHYAKHNRRLVGLGSYIVNAVSECNGCHSAGPATEYADGHNPYLRLGAFTPPATVNPATYLGGGRDFGQVGPVTSATVPPHIVSRNLTPDKSGLPEGGATFAEFYETFRHGTDHDKLHPNCSDTITTNCFNPPFNGNLLQVMPWPSYQHWTDHDLIAVYEYLKAIPCLQSANEVLAGVHACE